MSPRRTAHRDELTRIEIMAELGAAGPLNRSELASRLGLGPATVTDHARRLVAAGYLRELPPEVNGVGRPRVPLEVVPDAAYALGLRINVGLVVSVVVRLDGTIAAQRHHTFDAGDDPVGQLAAIVREALADPDTGERIRGVGLAVPGIIDPATGVVRMAPRLGWTELPLGERLAADLGVPVLVDNDLRASTTTELLFGTGRDHDDFLVLGIGDGVGMGIVLGRQVHRGPDGVAGEFGHTPVSADGPLCICGAYGCVDAYTSEPAILRAATERGLLPAGATLADLLAAAADSAGVRELLTETGTVLGRAVAGVVNLLAVRAVTVIGESHVLWPYLEPGFAAAIDSSVLPPLRGLEVIVRPWQDSAHARGAASLVLTRGSLLT
ncbi:ROK family transcriptional regulator [Actinocatenispora rupis]|uniref:Sugar kinase n=1 Tax=Actinocatenispora rupis TaxID=519421 RepID=A0A8J3NBM0_9ACTN|nr:ROK family transcriptional regulator [Actinocatenispora rupis]GID13206.1 sugar kinase [Actinocatenispora rupis]